MNPGAPESAVTPTAIVSHPAYQAAFEALRATLDDGDLQAARATSRRLRARLERERATLPTMEAARNNEGGPLSYQVLSGELPAKESAEGALRMVDGFDSVIEGRARVRALDLAVILSRVPDSEQVRVVLRARSAWPEPLELRPGAGTVEVLRTSLEPRAGDERRDSARIALPEATVLRVPANAEADHELCRLAIEMPLGAIATRMRVDTVFLGGTIQEGDERYPAQDFDVRSARRTDLAGKIPAVAVGPGPLLELVERGRAPLAAILERTVRIPPARFPETLDPANRERSAEARTLHPFRSLRGIDHPGVMRTNLISFLYLSAFSGMEFTLTFLAAERLTFGPHDNMWMFVFIGLMIAFVQGGGLGKVHCSRGLCYKPRRPIGRVDGPRFAPASLDYDRWLGPVEYRPLQRPRLHYDWHWDLHTGNGDLGNQGIHQMDIARWALGWDAMPKSVWSVGGRLGYEDDGDSPNTQVAVFFRDGVPLVFEVRGLPRDKAQQSDKWQMDAYEGQSIGNIIHGENGTVRISNSYSWADMLDPDGNNVQEWKGGGDHFANFVAAVRADDPSVLNASIEDGHLSSAYCHLGILSHRLGTPVDPAGVSQAWSSSPTALDAWHRMRDHLAANEVDLAAAPITLGRELRLNADATEVRGDPVATAMLRREDRPPFTF